MAEEKKMTVGELEDRIYELEEIRVVIRAPKDATVEYYNYQRKAATNMSMTEYLEKRLKPCIGKFEVSAYDGNGQTPHGRTNIENVRNSYVKK